MGFGIILTPHVFQFSIPDLIFFLSLDGRGRPPPAGG
jgi:hypothetical protein